MTVTAWAQVAQVGYGVSILGDVQKLPVHGSGQMAVGGPAQSGWLDQVTSRGNFQPQSF